MLGPYRRCVLLLALFAAGIACNRVQTTTSLQSLRMDESIESFGSYRTYMIDNAVLRDMSVADIHFIAHTGELSGIGEARLNRLAALLNTYGGTVRYETLLTDEPLIQKRLAHVREYLSLTGCNMDRVEVVAAMSGGRGLPGDEAVAKFNEATAGGRDAETTTPTLGADVLSPSGNEE